MAYRDTLPQTLAASGALAQGASAAPQVDKHPYVPGARVQQEYSATLKDMVRTYNSMRAKLLEAGLMSEKE